MQDVRCAASPAYSDAYAIFGPQLRPSILTVAFAGFARSVNCSIADGVHGAVAASECQASSSAGLATLIVNFTTLAVKEACIQQGQVPALIHHVVCWSMML